MLFQHIVSVYKMRSFVRELPFVGLIDTTGTEVAWFVSWLKDQGKNGLVIIPFQVYEETERGEQQKKWVIAIPPNDESWNMVRKRIREWEEDWFPLFTKKEQEMWVKKYKVGLCSTGSLQYEVEAFWKRKVLGEEQKTEEMWGNFASEDKRLRECFVSGGWDKWVKRQREKQIEYPMFYGWLESLSMNMEKWQVKEPDQCLVRIEGIMEKS